MSDSTLVIHDFNLGFQRKEEALGLYLPTKPWGDGTDVIVSYFLLVEEARVPGENHRSLLMKLKDRRHVSETIVGSAGIRTHALSDRGLLAQFLTTRPRRSPNGSN